MNVTLLGGHYRGDVNFRTGPALPQALSQIHADLALMSATAILECRLFHPIPPF